MLAFSNDYYGFIFRVTQSVELFCTYNKIGQLRKNQLVKVKYFTDGYYEDLPGRVDSVDAINKELRIYTGVTNTIGKELPTIIPFEDILEVNMN